MPSPQIDPFIRQLADFSRLWVLGGAGVSARSGIPTYRNRDGDWIASRPVQHQEFVQSPSRRQHYWGRSLRGWPAIRDAEPNAAHRHLAALEASGLIGQLVTQNVDRLHQRAGHQRVIDLHGRLDQVRCLNCDRLEPRQALQQRLMAMNPQLLSAPAEALPDGDAAVPASLLQSVRVANCEHCDGILKPDVVFFGDHVPRERVTAAFDSLAQSDAMLVVGSSLAVMSGFRFVRQAVKLDIPVFCINQGVTRGDALMTARIDHDLVEVLTRLRQHCSLPVRSASPSAADQSPDQPSGT